MNRRRGATEEPVQDYLDAARDQDPRNEETRLSADACRRSAETGHEHPSQRQEFIMTTVPHPRLHRPASAWVAEHDENGDQTHAMGPSIWEPGVDIYTASDPHSGPQAYDADGNLIPAGDLLTYACKLLRLHDELRRAQRHHNLAARQAAQR